MSWPYMLSLVPISRQFSTVRSRLPSRSFVLASLRALHVDRGCGQTAIATVKKTVHEEHFR